MENEFTMETCKDAGGDEVLKIVVVLANFLLLQ
jgi:hypothetical protein